MPSKTLCLAVSLLFAGFTGYATAQNVPRSSHVWIVAEENHSFEDVIGNIRHALLQPARSAVRARHPVLC